MFSLMVDTKGTHEEYGELFPGSFYKKGKCLHQGYLFLEEFLCGEAFMTCKTKEGGDFWDGGDFPKPFQV